MSCVHNRRTVQFTADCVILVVVQLGVSDTVLVMRPHMCLGLSPLVAHKPDDTRSFYPPRPFLAVQAPHVHSFLGLDILHNCLDIASILFSYPAVPAICLTIDVMKYSAPSSLSCRIERTSANMRPGDPCLLRTYQAPRLAKGVARILHGSSKTFQESLFHFLV